MPTTMTMLSLESGLIRYLSRIRQFPMLDLQEEQMLARRWREHEDSQAACDLITSHLRLVVKMAMGYRGYGLPVGDLISEGNLGLMQAVKRFEPDRGFRLSTYARWWIRASIQDYVLRSWSLVRMGSSANMKKLFFNLRHAKSRLLAYEEGDLSPENVGTMTTRLGVRQLVDDSDDQENVLVDHEEGDNRQMSLRTALKVLNPRERRILEARRLADNPVTLATLAGEFGVSRERIRQIEMRAFGKVQREVRASIAHIEERPPEAHAMGFVFIEDAQGEHKRTQSRLRH
jgi:RNA polymerase sigma-32 factor